MQLSDLGKRIGNLLCRRKNVIALLISLVVLGLMIKFFIETMNFRFSYHPPSMEQLVNGLDTNYNFKSASLRMLAERLYHHRATLEHDPNTSAKYIGIFPRLNTKRLPPIINDKTKDITLYRLVTAPPGQFSVRLAYIHIFDHERYIECLKAYNSTSHTFSPAIRDVIIKELLGIGISPNINDVANTVKDCLARIQSSLEPATATTVVANTSVAPYASNELISLVLDSYPDENLYKLLTHGYIGSQ